MSFEPIKPKEPKEPQEPKKVPWRLAWDSKRGPARSLRERPYHGKADRRRVIKERQEKKAVRLERKAAAYARKNIDASA